MDGCEGVLCCCRAGIHGRGSDERTYAFLVKGGEDTRQDQRVEEVRSLIPFSSSRCGTVAACSRQLFGLFNEILSQDPACLQRSLSIKCVP